MWQVLEHLVTDGSTLHHQSKTQDMVPQHHQNARESISLLTQKRERERENQIEAEKSYILKHIATSRNCRKDTALRRGHTRWAPLPLCMLGYIQLAWSHWESAYWTSPLRNLLVFQLQTASSSHLDQPLLQTVTPTQRLNIFQQLKIQTKI